MKKLLLIAPLIFCGCGLKVVHKQDALAAFDKVYGPLESARNEACSSTTTAYLESVEALIKQAVEQYLK